MNATSDTKTDTSRGADQQTFIVLGVLLQFLSTPEQVKDQISVMRGTISSGVVIPPHSHADPEIFYMLDGSLEVFQSEGWQTVSTGEVVTEDFTSSLDLSNCTTRCLPRCYSRPLSARRECRRVESIASEYRP
jgi:hypothetical protein